MNYHNETTTHAGTTPQREWSGVLVVQHREDVAEGVIAVTLSAPGGEALPVWEPGAHIDLVLGNGIVRQYSLCGNPADRTVWRVGVLREPASRGGSEWIHHQLHKGSVVTAHGPRNHFRLDEAPRYQFIAGGIGITPILPMIRAVDQADADWTLLYGGRTRASMAFRDELSGWGDRVTLWPADEHGLLDLDAALGTPGASTLVYACGPEALLAAIELRCTSWPDGALHLERFAAASDRTPSPAGERPIRVELRRSGVTVDVAPTTSILQAVTQAGADVLSSCEDGICGTCMTTVLDGVPDHHDSVLSAAERRAGTSMMICVSRAETDYLVLDL